MDWWPKEESRDIVLLRLWANGTWRPSSSTSHGMRFRRRVSNSISERQYRTKVTIRIQVSGPLVTGKLVVSCNKRTIYIYPLVRFTGTGACIENSVVASQDVQNSSQLPFFQR